ncbi:hypothetical protein [Chitinimonas sp.]|uniref:hypothetical protein n=1 Tax=Chitinimonas sp. TaxID=1934313 RepID=UPI002F947BCF
MLQGLLRWIDTSPVLPKRERTEIAPPEQRCWASDHPLAEPRERVLDRRAENMLSGF